MLKQLMKADFFHGSSHFQCKKNWKRYCSTTFLDLRGEGGLAGDGFIALEGVWTLFEFYTGPML